jgi:hypothetical protein
MDEAEETLIQRYVSEDEELRRYVEDHKKIEAELEAFNKRIYLSSEEEVEKKILQKRKLLGKEKIFKILEKYRKM